jgi:hypothetical protein
MPRNSAYSALRRMSVAEWVREALGLAHRRKPSTPLEKKLEVIRAAARHEFPSGDINRMLADIESGYVRPSGSVIETNES